jgi:hypothetical protein
MLTNCRTTFETTNTHYRGVFTDRTGVEVEECRERPSETGRDWCVYRHYNFWDGARLVEQDCEHGTDTDGGARRGGGGQKGDYFKILVSVHRLQP